MATSKLPVSLAAKGWPVYINMCTRIYKHTHTYIYICIHGLFWSFFGSFIDTRDRCASTNPVQNSREDLCFACCKNSEGSVLVPQTSWTFSCNATPTNHNAGRCSPASCLVVVGTAWRRSASLDRPDISWQYTKWKFGHATNSSCSRKLCML